MTSSWDSPSNTNKYSKLERTSCPRKCFKTTCREIRNKSISTKSSQNTRTKPLEPSILTGQLIFPTQSQLITDLCTWKINKTTASNLSNWKRTQEWITREICTILLILMMTTDNNSSLVEEEQISFPLIEARKSFTIIISKTKNTNRKVMGNTIKMTEVKIMTTCNSDLAHRLWGRITILSAVLLTLTSTGKRLSTTMAS